MPGPPSAVAAGRIGAAGGLGFDAWQNYQQGAKPIPEREKLIQVPKAYERRSRWNDRRSFQQEPEQIKWGDITIVPINKDFYEEHPSCSSRSPEDCEKIRLENSICIVNEREWQEEVPNPIEQMEEAPFPDCVYQVLRDKGFDKPTSIQVQAWPVALKGHDLVGIAETGSGKTMAYVPPMLVHILAQPELRPGEGPVGIVLLPSRELCLQVQREVQSFIHANSVLQDFKVTAVHGGTVVDQQQRALLDRCDIVISTPGRLMHLLNDRVTNLMRATFVVLDEADGLLDEGFEQQIRLIIKNIRPDRQVCLFSATWPEKIERLARDVCSFKPVHVNVGSIKLAACRNIEQTFFLVGDEARCQHPGLSKLEVLDISMRDIGKLLEGGDKALVFCNKQETVHEVVRELQARGHSCAAFTSAYPQKEREAILSTFRQEGGHIHFLVCTPLLGRGHDLSRLQYVINYDMPMRLVGYVHQIGRTGRAEKRGFALTLLEPRDLWMAKELVDCLNETSQDVPAWLKEACSKRKRKEYRDLRWSRDGVGAAPEAQDPAMLASSWTGRGRGRRQIFLAECQGRGPARSVAP